MKEVRDDPWTNLPQQRYLFDEVDFDDPEIRASKLELRALWRKGLRWSVVTLLLASDGGRDNARLFGTARRIIWADLRR